MSVSIKIIEQELYVTVFSLLNGGSKMPSKEDIQRILSSHLYSKNFLQRQLE